MSVLKRSILMFLLCVLAAGLAACGNNPYREEKGKSINYTALSEDPRTLDPAQVSDTTSAEILDQIYDSLYQNAYLDRPYRVEPALAAGYPEKRIFYGAGGGEGGREEGRADGVYLQAEGRHLFPGRPVLPRMARAGASPPGDVDLLHQEARRPDGRSRRDTGSWRGRSRAWTRFSRRRRPRERPTTTPRYRGDLGARRPHAEDHPDRAVPRLHLCHGHALYGAGGARGRRLLQCAGQGRLLPPPGRHGRLPAQVVEEAAPDHPGAEPHFQEGVLPGPRARRETGRRDSSTTRASGSPFSTRSGTPSSPRPSPYGSSFSRDTSMPRASPRSSSTG